MMSFQIELFSSKLLLENLTACIFCFMVPKFWMPPQFV